MLNVPYVIPRLEDPKLSAKGLKKNGLTKNEAKIYYSHYRTKFNLVDYELYP